MSHNHQSTSRCSECANCPECMAGLYYNDNRQSARGPAESIISCCRSSCSAAPCRCSLYPQQRDSRCTMCRNERDMRYSSASSFNRANRLSGVHSCRSSIDPRRSAMGSIVDLRGRESSLPAFRPDGLYPGSQAYPVPNNINNTQVVPILTRNNGSQTSPTNGQLPVFSSNVPKAQLLLNVPGMGMMQVPCALSTGSSSR